MLMPRDIKLINFLEDFHIATSGQLHRLFFPDSSIRYSSKRLKYLFAQGYIKRTRSTLTSGYAYFANKRPEQVHHDLLRVELFLGLKKLYSVPQWGNEKTVGGIRPDAVAVVVDHDVKFPVFIEIHLNNHFNFDKYKEMEKNVDLKAVFGLMPRVIICTDRQVTIPAMPVKFKVVGLDMKGLESIFK